MKKNRKDESKKFEFEAGVQKVKDKYKDIPEDVMHDIWISINFLLESSDSMDQHMGKNMAKKYYLKPNGEEY